MNLARLKETWRRLALRGIRYSNDYGKLDTVYRIADPWLMTAPAEQFRFTETNRLILQKIGRVHSLLEIGCGEGHQSLYLQQVCDRLTGLDVSARAVRRAHSRCQQAKFLVGDIFSQEVSALAPFDLVVACEVLYYMSDLPAALQRIRTICHSCLLTYVDGERETLERHTSEFLPETFSETIEFEQTRWQAVWWHGGKT